MLLKGLRPTIGFLVILGLTGCAPSSSGGAAGPGSIAPQAPHAPKVITAAALTPIKAFGAWDTSPSGGIFALHNIHSSPLFATDSAGNITGRLLSRLPSIDDGTIVVLPDGRMQTTWNLRPDVKWHDGAPFTSNDLAFTLQVYRDPDVGLKAGTAGTVGYIEQINAPSPTVAVATWKTTYYQPFNLSLTEFWPLPKHLLGTAFEGDKQTFRNLPYWTTDFVNTGPFRLTDYGSGEQVVFERFDDYFLGPPKVDKIVVRALSDSNLVVANLRSGAIDIASKDSLASDIAIQLDTEWKQSGEGTVLYSPGSFRFEVVQFDPRWAKPFELSHDVRIRQGLLLGIDRGALQEVLFPGVPHTSADSILPDSDPRTPSVGSPFSRYAYDPSQAAQTLASAGWRKSADGRLLNEAGDQIQLDIHNQPGRDKEAAVIAQYWRALGAQVSEVNVPTALGKDLEYNSTFPGFSGHANEAREAFVTRLLSTSLALPENRFTGANTGHYANTHLDDLYSTLTGTPDQATQLPLIKQMVELLASDLPILPSHYTVSTGAVRKGVTGLADDFQSDSVSLSRNAHLWDRV